MKTEYWNAIRIAIQAIEREWECDKEIKATIFNVVENDDDDFVKRIKVCEILSRETRDKCYIYQILANTAIFNLDEYEIELDIMKKEKKKIEWRDWE